LTIAQLHVRARGTGVGWRAEPVAVAIKRALDYVWDRYDSDLHLWAWGNGDVPAWMLMDAVSALHDAALALAPGAAEADRVVHKRRIVTVF
jgi:hypothetical protein